ncbi:hypothetical protein DNI29_22220 [Hymenobacter sediminis]|uniref:hypothetical protein n=1 Tax=Hymenobacter sediminis TaxID=2218621 RepID=UPI000DA6AF99|nr:hypothetical protein [Hymenobacter sediminis]RPD44116.1 hypothetical protein DNI29_22220 [Hymenobacter sediminis]
MGTTQRIIPGVTGEPNWGSLSLDVTTVSKTVDKEEQLANASQPNPRLQQKLSQRKSAQIKKTVGHLIASAGGRAAVRNGSSAATGRAGTRVARRLTRLFSVVGTSGLAGALTTPTATFDFTGLTVEEVITRILLLCADGSTGMDETAALAACAHVLEQLEQPGQTPQQFEAAMQAAVAGPGLEELLCQYFGYYIFEHLAQRFQEKITQLKGAATAAATFEEIKLDILGLVLVIAAARPLAQINWAGAQGDQIIEDIFDSILALY